MSERFVSHSRSERKSDRRLLPSAILRFVMVLLVAAGWFVLSNHCVLGVGLEMAHAKAAHVCCENGSTTSAKDHSAPDGTIVCCKAVQAVAQDAAKVDNLKPNLAHLLFAVAWILELERQDESRAVLNIRGDTLPPSAISFSELVLQRSLLAHAPPALV